MTENQAIQLFLKLLHKERQEYPDKPEKREGIFSRIIRYMKRGERI
ncbi:MAG: hypothetical protein K2G89_06340 [Lachnospiraceae bacterium]|nr:hypothetical protein [Lachnospiraceae bacterium]